ncbi:MAG: phosphoethanolamine transferase [Burkholderiales bacterium]|nr:phosphoethanolamine transferase [Burkholderiales bacterium]
MALLAPFEALYVWHFGVPSGPHVYAVVAESNFEELSTWVGADWALQAMLGLAWLSAVVWAAHRWQGSAWVLSLRSRVALVALGLCVLLPQGIATGWINPLDQMVQEGDPEAAHLQHAVRSTPSGFGQFWEATYPWGLPQRLIHWAEYRAAARRHAQMSSTHRFRLQVTGSDSMEDRLVVVLVIGEASRADRWSLYGAKRNTTPQLLAMKPELLVFRDAVAGASATREAITLMLTRRPEEEPLGVRSEGSVVSAFRQAGFKTYWLSTQGNAGAHETPVSVMASEAHERQFLSASDYRGRTALDKELLPPLQEILYRREPKVFVVLHTMGSHLHYANRYPLGLEPFQPALQREQAPNIWRKERLEELVNAYDNSLHYTDSFVAGVIHLLKNSGAIAQMNYMPDHGETLFDGACPRGGHGFASIANYHVPLVMWASEGWKARFAKRWQRLQSRQEAPVSALAVFPTLLGQAGIQLLDGVSHTDLGAEHWEPTARPTAHFGDFDRNIATTACDAPASASPARARSTQNFVGRLGNHASTAPWSGAAPWRNSLIGLWS